MAKIHSMISHFRAVNFWHSRWVNETFEHLYLKIVNEVGASLNLTTENIDD